MIWSRQTPQPGGLDTLDKQPIYDRKGLILASYQETKPTTTGCPCRLANQAWWNVVVDKRVHQQPPGRGKVAPMSVESPELADGYTPIVNSIMESLARQQMSGAEWQVIVFLIRKTYGWSKASDVISLGQISDGTGISRSHVARAMAKLVQRHLVVKTVAKSGNTTMTRLALNKHCGEWTALPKQATVLPNQATGVLPGQATGKTSEPHEDSPTAIVTVLPGQATGDAGVLPNQATTITREDKDKRVKEKATWCDDPEPTVPFQDVLDLWRSVCVPVGMHNLRDITPMKQKIQAAWNRLGTSHDPDWADLSTLERLGSLFKTAASCPFLRGENDRKWAADLEFVLRPLSIERIMSGYYSRGVQEVAPGTYVRGGVAVRVNPSPATAFSAAGLNDKIRVEPDDDDDTPKEW